MFLFYDSTGGRTVTTGSDEEEEEDEIPQGPAGSLQIAPGEACESLRLSATLLGVGESALLTALNSRTISAGGESFSG